MIDWKYSGLENAARVIAKQKGFGNCESWCDNIRATANNAYTGKPTYVETNGFCVTIWHDANDMPHAKVTLSVYGIAKEMGIWENEY